MMPNLLAWAVVLADIGTAGAPAPAPAPIPAPDLAYVRETFSEMSRQALGRPVEPDELRTVEWFLAASPGEGLADYVQWFGHRELVTLVRDTYRDQHGREPGFDELLAMLRAAEESLGVPEMVDWIVARVPGGREANESVEIQGRVRDAASGLPVEDAELFVLGDLIGRSERTGQAGLFSMPPVAARANGTVMLMVRAPRRAVWTRDLERDPETGSFAPVEVVLQPGAVVDGAVVDADGRPVPAARVTTLQIGTITDKNGRFRIEGLDPVESFLHLAVLHPDFQQTSATGPMPPPFGKETFTIRLKAGYEVRGRVVDPDGAPVAGARVTRLDSATFERVEWVLSAADGAFRMRRCEPGSWTILAESPAWAAAWQPAQTGPGVETTEMTIELGRGREVEGILLDPDGAPIPRGIAGWIRVENGPSLSLMTPLRDGAFRFAAVPAVAITVRAAEMTPGLRSAEAGIGQDQRQVTMTAEIPSEISGYVEAQVVDGTTGNPVPAYRAQLRFPFACGDDIDAPDRIPDGYRWRTFANPEGRLRFPGEAGKGYMVLINAPGHAPFRWCATASPPRTGDDALPVVELTPGVPLHGRIVDAAGNPLPGARVLLCDSMADIRVSADYDRAIDETSTDPDGRFVFADRGSHADHLVILRAGHAVGALGPVIPADTSPDDPATVRLPPPSRILVQAPRLNGGVSTLLYRQLAPITPDGPRFEIRETRYVPPSTPLVLFNGLAPGPYLVACRRVILAADAAPVRFLRVEVGEGDGIEADLRYTARAMNGVLRFAGGSPAAGCVVGIAPDNLPEVVGPAAMRVRTDEDGKFIARGVSPGRWTVTVRAETDGPDGRNGRLDASGECAVSMVEPARVELTGVFHPATDAGEVAPAALLETCDPGGNLLGAADARCIAILFWAGWSGPSVAELDTFAAARDAWGSRGARFATIDIDPSQTPPELQARARASADVAIEAVDGWNAPAARAAALTQVPAVLILDSDGRLLASEVRQEMLPQALEILLTGDNAAVDVLLAGLRDHASMLRDLRRHIDSDPAGTLALFEGFYADHPELARPGFYDDTVALLRKHVEATAQP